MIDPSSTGHFQEPNVLRDGKYLVVPLQNAVFPNRCVKSNVAIDKPSVVFHGNILRQQMHKSKSLGEAAVRGAAMGVLGVNAGGAIDLVATRRLKLTIGLTDELQQRNRARRRLGLFTILGGIALVFALGLIGIPIDEHWPGRGLTASLVGGGIGIAVFVAGIIVFAIAEGSMLRVITSDGTYVWLEGAHPDFLAGLPDSPVHWKPLFSFGGG